jgi:AcrR family transcriptional regulator
MTAQTDSTEVVTDGDVPFGAGVGHTDALISRSLILQTALTILDRDGESGLSMRRLSEALKRDPTVLYRHLPNKDAVLDNVAEIILSQLSVDITDTGWVKQLRLGLHRLRVAEFPQLRGLASVLASYDGAAELDRGVDVILGGLNATVAQRV